MEVITKKSTFNFNKEIMVGEIAALISAPLFSYIISNFTNNVKIISLFAVIGAIVGGNLCWLFMRIYDKEKENEFSIKNMTKDIAYFTPAAFLFTSLFYYPTLYFLSSDFLNSQEEVLTSIILAQFAAFALFLLMINIYRYLLAKSGGRVL